MLTPRDALRDRVHRLVGFEEGAIDLARPAGDPGLFGPGSASWAVHADFTSMMIGGIAALLMQMLHPGALAGVWDHSNWREDRVGRLRRTAQFIAATTYGATAEAERLIARVRAIHDHVTGSLPDGTPYAANDPALLTWVHVAEARSFLAAYLRYRAPDFSGAMQDRYYVEAAEVAERLGARDVPRDRNAVEAYLRKVRPQLRYDARTRAVAGALLSSPNSAAEPVGALLRAAAADMLPTWAADMHGLTPSDLRRPAIRASAHGLGGMLRWALRDGSASSARRRVDA